MPDFSFADKLECQVAAPLTAEEEVLMLEEHEAWLDYISKMSPEELEEYYNMK